MAQFINYYDVDLWKPSNPMPLRQMACEGDVRGLRVGAVVTSNGETVSLGGSCVGKVVRADGATVTLTGTINGNIAYVVLDQASCSIEGPIQVAVCWVSGSDVTTLVVAYGTVVNTQTGVAIQPSTPIPDLAQLLAAISDMQTATAAANAAASGALGNFAPAFAEATANAAGSYVTYTDGKLYYLPSGHTANVTWANTTKTAVTVGAELSDLKSAFNELLQPVNLFDKTEWQQGTLDLNDLPSGTGAFTASSQNTGASGYIEVSSGTTYCALVNTSWYGGQANRVCQYDASKNFLGICFGSVTDSINVFTPGNASVKYIRFVINPTQKETGMMVKGSVYPSDYIPYGQKMLAEDYGLNDTQKGEVDDLIDASGIEEVKATVEDVTEYLEPVNLFNKDSTLNKSNYLVQISSDYVSYNGSTVTHPIPIVVGQEYSFLFSGSYYGDTANSVVRYCKSDGTLVGDGQNATVNTDQTLGKYGTFTAVDKGADARYVCVNVRSTLLSSMMFVEGGTIPAYSEWFEAHTEIKAEALPTDMPLPANAQSNILYGKKAAFTGDSICYGAGYTGGYASIIGANNGMTISNTGEAGATLATGTTTGGVNRPWISTKVANMPANYDYYIVEGGVNDAAGDVGVQLGTMSDGYTATLDTTTLYGAMETICKTLQTTFLGKKYGFIFPHNCYAMTHRWNTEFRPAMKECLKKWGIPFLDLSEKTAELNNVSTLRVYTSNSDGWHPTEDGYKLFYVDKITAWMRTL